MSYSLDTELVDYATARGYTLLADPNVLLTKAHDWIESMIYSGEKTDPDQPYEFPRTGIVVGDKELDPTVVPNSIIIAEMRMAIEIDKGNDPFEAVPRAVKREKVSDIEVEYKTDSTDTPVSRGIMHLIKPYLANYNIFGYDR